MRLSLALLGLLVLLSSCFVSSSLHFSEADIDGAHNLIRNHSFDPHLIRGTESLPGWTLKIEPHNADYDKVVIDAQTSSDGGNSLKISASDKDVLIISEPFDVRRYGGYFAKISAKSDSPNPPKIQFRMITFKEQGKITNRFKEKYILNDEWQDLHLSAGFLRPGVRFGRIFVHIPPFEEGSIWLDNAGCWEVHGFRID
ncbi:MAG: hypothetical protein PHC50_04685 [Candidatus Cloacimonetes bacterium]|nr:hypothetical protein [Candidatus Cloacimonadota bacterium]